MEYNDLNNTIAYSITSTILRHGTIPDDTAYFLSRDAKSCVSQAAMLHLLRWWNTNHCRVFCSGDAKFCVSTGEDAPFIEAMKCLSLPRFSTRETQNFASLLGWRQHIFSTKQAALSNMKASFHCSHWHCFCIMKNTHLNRKSTFRQSTQTLQHNHHRLDKNESRESGYS